MYIEEVNAVYAREPIGNTFDAARILKEQFADFDREYVYVVNVTSNGKPISYHMVGIGDTNATHFPISTMFKTALLQNAVSIIICHNHPGGTAYPSTEDISATKAIIEAGRMLGIRVLDHFIFTPHEYVSMKEVMPELF